MGGGARHALLEELHQVRTRVFGGGHCMWAKGLRRTRLARTMLAVPSPPGLVSCTLRDVCTISVRECSRVSQCVGSATPALARGACEFDGLERGGRRESW